MMDFIRDFRNAEGENYINLQISERNTHFMDTSQRVVVYSLVALQLVA